MALTNATPRAVTYRTILIGDSDFTVPASVTVPPQGRADLQVQCTPRFSRGAAATLYAVPVAGRGVVQASALVFFLQAELEVPTSKPAVHCDVACYARKDFVVSITNPLSTAAEFQVCCLQPVALSIASYDLQVLFVMLIVHTFCGSFS